MKVHILHNGSYDLKTPQNDIEGFTIPKSLKYLLLCAIGVLASSIIYSTYQVIWHLNQKSGYEMCLSENTRLKAKLKDIESRSLYSDQLMQKFNDQQIWLKERYSAAQVLSVIFEAIPEKHSTKELCLKQIKGEKLRWKLSMKFREIPKNEDINTMKSNLKGYAYEIVTKSKKKENVEGILKHDI